MRKQLDLVKRYGEGSWALVTGASTGIGAEYCMQLAKAGFNVCLVSRTREKLMAVSEDIEKNFPKVKTCVFAFDFENTEMDSYQRLCDAVKSSGLDVSLLVINAG